MIANETIKLGLLGSIVLAVAVAGVLVYLLVDVKLDKDITLILSSALILCGALIILESVIYYRHTYPNPAEEKEVVNDRS